MQLDGYEDGKRRRSSEATYQTIVSSDRAISTGQVPSVPLLNLQGLMAAPPDQISAPRLSATPIPTSEVRNEGAANAEDAKRERQRQLSRVHQLRHRMKRRKVVLDLEDDIRHLRQELFKLEVRREVLHLDISIASIATTSIWHIAAEYCRLFRNGVQCLQPPVDLPNAFTTRVPYESRVQRDFLKETMAEDVWTGSTRGIEALLHEWRLVSLYHKGIDIQLVRLQSGPDNSLIAAVKGTSVISDDTIHYAFSHLIQQDGRSPIASKLVGQELIVHGSVFFEWNNDSNRVTRVQYQGDLLSPLLRLVRNLEDICQVFERACITPDCRIVGASEGEAL